MRGYVDIADGSLVRAFVWRLRGCATEETLVRIREMCEDGAVADKSLVERRQMQEDGGVADESLVGRRQVRGSVTTTACAKGANESERRYLPKNNPF